MNKYVYLAGLVDGDGSIFIDRHSRKNTGWCNVIISVTNTDYTLIKWLSENFGGNIVSQRNRKREWYIWRVANEPAFNIIRKIYPYLISKKKQAEIAIEFWSKKIDLRTVPKSQREEEIKRRLRLIDEMHHENTRLKDRDSICPHPKTQKSKQD